MKWGMWAMQSKTSLINKELLVYIFRSSGWISLLYLLGLLFSLPLEVLMAVLEEREQYYPSETNLFFIHGSIQYALLLVIPVLLGVFLFRFLQVKQQSDFIHNLPLSRKQIYVHHVGAGIIFLLLPIFITAFILFIFVWTMDVSQLYTLSDLGVWMGTTTVIALLTFSATVFIGMITGLSALQAILTYIFLLLPVGLLVLFVSNMKFLLFGFSQTIESESAKLSPLTALTDIHSVALFSVENTVYLIVSVCLLFLSFLLYKQRKLEYVSHAFVFPIIKPVFKYGLTTCLMLFGGFYFSETTERFEWVIFGYVLGVVFGYLLAEMVLQKTWRIRFQLKGFGFYVFVLLLLIFVIKLDVFGFESRVPETSAIKKVSISNNFTNYHDDSNIQGMTLLKDKSNIVAIQKLHEQIIKYGENDVLNISPEYPTISLEYELENGHTLSREYQLRNYESFTPYFQKIYESQEYKENFYTILHTLPKEVYRVHISGNGNLNKFVELSDPKEIKKAIELLQTDVSNLSYEKMKNENQEYGYINITLSKNRSISLAWEGSYQQFNDWMEHTGKADQARIQAEDVSYIIVQEYNPKFDYYGPDFSPEKNALKVKNMDRKNELLKGTDSRSKWKFVVLLYGENGDTLDVRGLSAGNVPDFVQAHFIH